MRFQKRTSEIGLGLEQDKSINRGSKWSMVWYICQGDSMLP
jgi:hypothetical protein